MEKAKFSNEYFYLSMLLFLFGLFAWNVIILISSGTLLAIMPLTIGAVLIFLIATKNKFSRLAIMIWSMIFLIIASILQLLGRLITDSIDNFVAFDLPYYVKAIISIAIGLVIYIYAKNTIVIEKTESTI
jgi:hypothetical protein